MTSCEVHGFGWPFLFSGIILLLFGMLLFVVRITAINITIKNGIYKKLGSPRLLILSDLFPLHAFRARRLIESAADRRWITINFYFFSIFTGLFVLYLISFILKCG